MYQYICIYVLSKESRRCVYICVLVYIILHHAKLLSPPLITSIHSPFNTESHINGITPLNALHSKPKTSLSIPFVLLHPTFTNLSVIKPPFHPLTYPPNHPSSSLFLHPPSHTKKTSTSPTHPSIPPHSTIWNHLIRGFVLQSDQIPQW